MNKNASVEATKLLPSLKANIDEFVGEAPQFDDITMLMLDYKPKKGGKHMTNKTFPAKTESLNEVLGFVEETLEGFACPMNVQMAICVAMEEVFVNIAHYAYTDGVGDMTLLIGFDENSRTVTFRMTDKGIPFDPLQKPDPDITLSAEEREIGGLGIFITKNTMDSVTYAYENGENILSMIKTF
jgi:sigma-B regulation protein RsbU (phosphoserine phosphatase)